MFFYVNDKYGIQCNVYVYKWNQLLSAPTAMHPFSLRS